MPVRADEAPGLRVALGESGTSAVEPTFGGLGRAANAPVNRPMWNVSTRCGRAQSTGWWLVR